MIKKLILSKQSYIQLGVVIFGSFFGLLLVMVSMQFFYDFKYVIQNKEELLNPQYIVVNKSVSMLNTITGKNNGFLEEEIKTIQNIESIEEIGKFKANKFKAQTAFEFMSNAIYTDIFFESIPDKFLDIKVEDWQWQTNYNYVPIILPVDYINLYNFGFAPSQGLPQISQSTAKNAPLKVKIIGRNKELILNGKIAGFTNRINSILVPDNFLEYANLNFGDSTTQNTTSRIVLKSNDPSNSALLNYLKEKGYETNFELLKNGKLNAILKIILIIVLIIGGVIVLLSLLGFIQYSQLLINNSKHEIKTLLHIGFYHQSIFKKYFAFYSIIIGIIGLLGFVALFVVKKYFTQIMLLKGFETENNVQQNVWLLGIIMLVVFLSINAFNIYRMIKKMAKPV